MISWDNKLDVIGFIRGQRFYCEEHINASELHVVRAAYFKSAMAAREGRQGSARELLGRVVENCDGGGGRSERGMSCSLYLRRSHVISAVIGLGI